MLTQVGNTASGTWREREAHRAFMVELHALEAAAKLKAEAPLRQLEQEFQASANALAQMEAKNLLVIPDESPEGQRLMAYCDRITDDMVQRFAAKDWAFLAELGMKDALILWELEHTPLPDAEEVVKCRAYLIANRLSPGDGNSWVSALARLTGFCLRLRPAPVIEREPEVVEEVLPPYGSREREIHDRIQYQTDLAAELSPTFREAVASIQESSGLSMDVTCQKQLFAKFAEGRKPLNIINVRESAIALWGSKMVGLLPEEKERYKYAGDEELTSDQFVQKHRLGNPRGSNDSGAPLSHPGIASAFRAGVK